MTRIRHPVVLAERAYRELQLRALNDSEHELVDRLWRGLKHLDDYQTTMWNELEEIVSYPTTSKILALARVRRLVAEHKERLEEERAMRGEETT